MKSNLLPVILAGGCGSRLWPLSNPTSPKQFIKFSNQLSLFQQSILRNKVFGKPVAIINHQHEQIALEQIKEIEVECDLVSEPSARGTAICSILAGFIAKSKGYDNVLLTPSDHLIEDHINYTDAIYQGAQLIRQAPIVTIGINPTTAKTKYGYIKCHKQIADSIFISDQFVEKPSNIQAQSYLETKNFLWNSGIFLYNTNKFLRLANQLAPSMLKTAIKLWRNRKVNTTSINFCEDDYKQVKVDTIDYLFLERIKNIAVVLAKFEWSDLGDFNCFFDALHKDNNNNYLSQNTITSEVTNSCIIHHHKIALVLGIENAIIVSNKDCLLIASKEKVSELKHYLTDFKIFKNE